MPSGDVNQSVLFPAGTQAFSIHHLWSLMLWVTTAVFAIVLVFVFVALVRGMRNTTSSAPATSPEALTRSVAAAVAMTVVILFALLVVSVRTGSTVAALRASSAVTVAVTGHQWWWEIEYEDAVPSRRVLTANEIHLPVSQPIVLKVTSRDVIHSFWLPSLQGKRDLIPGYTTAIWMQADRPGVFRGQCAEFCGLQHAHMAFDVVAEPIADFERWLEAMRQPAVAPRGEAERRGHDVFMTNRCAGCHTIRGTEAHGQIAPDLTHFATRSTIGAGTLPNTPEHLGAWLLDPQATKPGNQMPPNPLAPDDSRALIAYLETLR
jgi:cytochrome c oxidase subunit II